MASDEARRLDELRRQQQVTLAGAAPAGMRCGGISASA